ncbi:hypothetical protein JWZ98_08695 [Methylomonas sp. EFPC1]|uniref:hypothetical protein n=1 Tax=Methylomonas sp. EFPC1 TaxID=2812647 RepID=UPI001966F8C1|nr:hypothetical protein [Methylomonas sp. EFPC1]QSB02992.1 hypothetical protein JWZ98_08695 [Methylomonas sp. EFPC1]
MSVEAIICYLKPLSEDEIISINKYWTLKDSSKDEFEYTLKQIDSKRERKSRNVSNLVLKSLCLVNNQSFYCKDCKQAKPVKSRKEFSERLRVDSFVCRECKEKQLISLREKSAKVLANFLDDLLNKSDYFSQLTYIDKLVLLTLLFDDYQEKKPVITSNARINITGSENVDMPVLSRLVGLGALVKITDLPKAVALAQAKLYESSVTLDYKQNRYRYRAQHNQLVIEKGIYFSLPLGFNNSAEFIERIYNDIINGGISVQKITELKRMVIDMQVENFNRLIDHVSGEFNLEISNSVPLSALLNHLSEKYPITKCYYTFSHQARRVIVYMHQNEPASYAISHLFTKFVGSYIQMLEENGWELKYIRILPVAVSTSNLEALVSHNFIDSHFNWHSLSATEVIERWLSKITIHNAPALLP